MQTPAVSVPSCSLMAASVMQTQCETMLKIEKTNVNLAKCSSPYHSSPLNIPFFITKSREIIRRRNQYIRFDVLTISSDNA